MTARASFRQGDVLSYPYLWHWQAARGETGGRKDRPACVVLPLQKGGETHLFLLAITSTPPRADQAAVEIPETEQRRAGLRGWKQGWAIVDEFNYDIAERSFHLEPAAAVQGRFSEAFVERLKRELRSALQSGGARRVDRSDEALG